MNFVGVSFGAGSGIRLQRFKLGVGSLIASVLTITATHAAPLQIQLVDQEFSTYTYSRRLIQNIAPPYYYETTSNRITADFPVTDVISNAAWNQTDRAYSGPVQLEVQAEADWSQVRSYTRSTAAIDGLAISAAITQIRFTSLNAGLADFDFDFLFDGEKYFAPLIRLRDLTLDQEVWSYGCNSQSSDSTRLARMPAAGTTWQETIPLLPIGGSLQAQMSIETLLNTTSTYELTLFTTVDCNYPEREDSQIFWTVPTAIPEPSAWALLVVGLTVTLLPRHRLPSRR
jgi:hypothetical protein